MTGYSPSELIGAARCLQCIPPGLRRGIMSWLMDQWLRKTQPFRNAAAGLPPTASWYYEDDDGDANYVYAQPSYQVALKTAQFHSKWVYWFSIGPFLGASMGIGPSYGQGIGGFAMSDWAGDPEITLSDLGSMQEAVDALLASPFTPDICRRALRAI